MYTRVRSKKAVRRTQGLYHIAITSTTQADLKCKDNYNITARSRIIPVSRINAFLDQQYNIMQFLLDLLIDSTGQRTDSLTRTYATTTGDSN